MKALAFYFEFTLAMVPFLIVFSRPAKLTDADYGRLEAGRSLKSESARHALNPRRRFDLRDPSPPLSSTPEHR